MSLPHRTLLALFLVIPLVAGFGLSGFSRLSTLSLVAAQTVSPCAGEIELAKADFRDGRPEGTFTTIYGWTASGGTVFKDILVAEIYQPAVISRTVTWDGSTAGRLTISAAGTAGFWPFEARATIGGVTTTGAPNSDLTVDVAAGQSSAVVAIGASNTQFTRISTVRVTFTPVAVTPCAATFTNPGDVTVPATGPDGAVDTTWTTVTATAVGRPISVTCRVGNTVLQEGAVFPIGSTTVTCAATDTVNHTGSISFTVTVSDLSIVTPDAYQTAEDTLLTVPAAEGLLANDSGFDEVQDPGVYTGTNGLGSFEIYADGSFTYQPAANVSGDDTFVYTAVGPGGSSDSATVTVTITPVNDVPVAVADSYTVTEDIPLVVSAPGILANDSDADGDTLSTALVTGPASGTLTLNANGSFTYTPAPNFNGTDSFGYRVSDGTDLSPPVLVTLTVSPVNDAPIFDDDSFPDSIGPIEATSSDGAVVSFDPPTATDPDSGDTVFVACIPASGGTFPIGTTTVDCTASDGEATDEASFTVTVVDTTDPVLTLPTPVVVEATSPAGASVPFTATATDTVDDTVAVVCRVGETVITTPGIFPVGTTTVTCLATDDSGNTSDGNFTVSVLDSTDPIVTVPDDITVEATGPTGASVPFAVSATDLVDSAVAVTCRVAGNVITSPGVFPLGRTTVTCSATDTAGNIGSASFSVTVEDTITPVFGDLPGDPVELGDETVSILRVSATGPTTPVSWPTVTATDAVSGTIAATCTPASGTGFVPGDTSVDCTASDAAGHPASASFIVRVTDGTAPVIDAGTIPANRTLEATGPSGASTTFTPPTFTDAVDGTLTATCDAASGSTFALGETTVRCTVTDVSGNPASVSFTVTVVDTTAPVVGTLPGSGGVLVAAATGPTTVVTWTAVSATDVVDGALTAVCILASGSGFAIGDTTVGCTATDAAGNVSQVSTFIVRVTDDGAPVFSGVSGPLTIEATSAAGAVVTYPLPVATDAVDGVRPVSCNPVSGSTFARKTTTVTCTASDLAGNTVTVSFTVKVIDTTGPVITWVGGPQPNRTYTRASLPAAPTCTAADMGSEVTQCRVYGYETTPGTWTLTARARDTEGNSTVSTRTYTVTGTTTPTATAVPPRPTATVRPPTQTPVPTATLPPRPTATPVPAQPTVVQPTSPPAPTPTPSSTRPPRR